MAEKLARAKTVATCGLSRSLAWGLNAEALALVEATGLPFATMLMEKTALDETHPQYIGIYDGRPTNLKSGSSSRAATASEPGSLVE